MEMDGRAMTVWTARAAGVLYVVWVALLAGRRAGAARVASAAGLGVYVVHVCCAFQFVYGWSHETAYRETARQTAELFGVDWGGGLYLNYLFTAAWAGDCVWAWASAGRARARWAGAAVHGFLAFMWVNATVVVWVLRAAAGR